MVMAVAGTADGMAVAATGVVAVTAADITDFDRAK
jgi:hypothetical protein